MSPEKLCASSNASGIHRIDQHHKAGEYSKITQTCPNTKAEPDSNPHNPAFSQTGNICFLNLTYLKIIPESK